MEKFGITAMGLSKDVKASMGYVGEIQGNLSRFLLTDGEVMWYCRLKRRFRRPKFAVVWVSPNGQIFKQDYFQNVWEDHEFAKTTLKLDPQRPDIFLGRWRVTIYEKKELVDDRFFEVVSA